MSSYEVWIVDLELPDRNVEFEIVLPIEATPEVRRLAVFDCIRINNMWPVEIVEDDGADQIAEDLAILDDPERLKALWRQALGL